MMSCSPWDKAVFVRTSWLFGLCSGLCWVVIAATDEGGRFGEVWGRRLGMWAAFAPALGMIAVSVALGIARARGEERALAALGVSPARVALFAVMAGALWGGAGACSILWEKAEVEVLFPRPAGSRVWEAEGGGAVLERSLGIRVLASGEIVGVETVGGRGASALSEPRAPLWVLRLCAAVSGLLIAGFGSLWAVAKANAKRKAAVGALWVFLLLLSYQAAALRPRYAWLVAAVPLLLVAEVLGLHYRSRLRR